MKQKILRKKGALQEGFAKELPSLPNNSSSFNMDEVPQMQQAPEDILSYVDMHSTNINIPSIRGRPVVGTQSAMVRSSAESAAFDPATGREIDAFTGRYKNQVVMPSVFGQGDSQHDSLTSNDITPYNGWSTMFRTTIPEGHRVLVYDKSGKGTIVEGPQRISSRGKRIEPMVHHIAYPGEFLVVKYRDGKQEHIPGPCEAWFDPRVHASMIKEDVLQIAAKEAIVVYSREEENGEVHRRLVHGPAVFVPEPGEWLHTFSWHGSPQGMGYQKVPGALVFQKLWLMPDQMYHDVEAVRTSDDVVLTVKLMLFFELVDLDRMLEETHDPIGDFINAATSDVLELIGRYSFDDFKTKTEQLNNLDNYPQLMGRAQQVGYTIHKIVYRGYSTARALEAMHEKAIETRTRLKLERETENQAQELADFKQQREAARSSEERRLAKERDAYELNKLSNQHEQQLQLAQQRRETERTQLQADVEQELSLQRQKQEGWLSTLAQLKELGVDLSSYLTQGRADQVIELRGGQDDVTPHLHLPGSNNS